MAKPSSLLLLERPKDAQSRAETGIRRDASSQGQLKQGGELWGITQRHSSPYPVGWMLSCTSSDPNAAVLAQPLALTQLLQPCSPHCALDTARCPGLPAPSLGDAHMCPASPCLATGQCHGQTQLTRTVWLGVIRLLLLRRGIIFIIIILCRGESVCKRSNGPAECLCVRGPLWLAEHGGWVGGWWGLCPLRWEGRAVPWGSHRNPTGSPAEPGLAEPTMPVPAAMAIVEICCQR